MGYLVLLFALTFAARTMPELFINLWFIDIVFSGLICVVWDAGGWNTDILGKQAAIIGNNFRTFQNATISHEMWAILNDVIWLTKGYTKSLVAGIKLTVPA